MVSGAFQSDTARRIRIIHSTTMIQVWVSTSKLVKQLTFITITIGVKTIMSIARRIAILVLLLSVPLSLVYADIEVTGTFDDKNDAGFAVVKGDDISDPNTTSGNILASDATKFDSVPMSGDASITSAGVVDINWDNISDIIDEAINWDDISNFGSGKWLRHIGSTSVNWDDIEEADIADLTHTTDTGPSPDCSGSTTYQDGEGGCDTLDSGTDITADLEEEGVTCSGCIDSGKIASDGVSESNINWDDINIIDSGNINWDDVRSVQPELVACEHKIAFEDPVDTDDHFFDELSRAETFDSIYCKTLVGTVDLDVTIAGSDINGSDITCSTSGVLDISLAGDTAGASGEEIALAVTSVASAPTYLMVRVNCTYDD